MKDWLTMLTDASQMFLFLAFELSVLFLVISAGVSLIRQKIPDTKIQAMLGTRLAHVDGGVPNLLIQVEALDAYHVGQLIYFFEYACGLSGYLLDVNPFDQPGVEGYKRLLGPKLQELKR